MVSIGDALVSFDVFQKRFCCDLNKCHGVCCVEGDSGAPITEEENKIIKELYPRLKNRMKAESVLRVEEKGLSFVDQEDELVTMIHENSGECVFAIQEGEMTVCAIEKMWEDGETSFRKPISCHLYPIRLTEYPDFIAVNYDVWDICKCAIKKGEKEDVPVYKFLKDALIRRFGEDWYAQLEIAAKDMIFD